MEVYLDNSATTRVSDKVIETVTKVMQADFGNPSSKHMLGVRSEQYIKDARKTLAGILKLGGNPVDWEKQIIFTSGGTESNNTAIIGTAMANARAGKHIITTAFEHDSVLQPMGYLEQEGFEISRLSVDSEGHISPDELAGLIRPDTILVSVMFVNNEIGAVQNIARIGAIIKECNPKTLFHVDAVQAFGKYEIFPSRMGIDLLSVSAHKIHGPKGAGFLYVGPNVKIRPLILGGGQQKGMRSGTDNVPGVAGLAVAAAEIYGDLEAERAHLITLKDRFIDGLLALGTPVRINSAKGELGAPHIVSATFAPIKSEVLLHALEDKGIYVSAGSACASNRKEKSHTLAAIGLNEKEQDTTLRFSFCRYTTEEEIDYTLRTLKELVPQLSRFVAR